MFRGKQAVFLSCSHRYKEQVAWSFRDALQKVGVLGIVVEDLPLLGTAWTADEKVHEYLRVSDAFAAVCTPDDEHADGSWWPRENIPEEIARARGMAHLQHKVAVIKAPSVSLPSNLVPAYDRMDLGDLNPAINALLAQLRQWDFDIPDVDVDIERPVDQVGEVARRIPLLGLFRLGDEEGNSRRIRDWMVEHRKPEQHDAVEQILDVVRDTERWTAAENAAYVLEYLARVDLSLFPPPLIDELSHHPDFAVRSLAAVILWTAATIAPGSVPLDIVIRLILSGEDWYVVTPSQRALQQLALSRVDAMQVLIDLASDSDRDNRVYAAKAFAALAAVRPYIVPRPVVEALVRDPDVEIRDDAQRALTLMPADAGANWRAQYGEFSAF